MKRLIGLILFLFLFQGLTFPQEVPRKLKEEALEFGLQLAQPPETLKKEKEKFFAVSPLKTIPLTVPSYRVACNPKYSAFSLKNGNVMAYDVESKTIVLDENFSKNPIYSVAFHPSKNIICFGDREGRIRIFDLDKKVVIHTIYELGRRISEVKFSPDGTRLATGDLERGEINIYETNTYGMRQTIKAHPEGIYYLAFSPDSKLLASGSRDKKIGITPVDQKWPVQILDEHRFFVLSLDFSINNRFLASGGGDGKLIVWQEKENIIEKMPYFVWIHGNWVTTAKFFKNYLISGSKDGKIRIFDYEKRQLLANFKTPGSIFSIDLAPQEEYLFVASGQEIVIYDFKQILEKITKPGEK